jgi:hypothetical protein
VSHALLLASAGAELVRPAACRLISEVKRAASAQPKAQTYVNSTISAEKTQPRTRWTPGARIQGFYFAAEYLLFAALIAKILSWVMP